jgi:hypothetical protein
VRSCSEERVRAVMRCNSREWIENSIQYRSLRTGIYLFIKSTCFLRLCSQHEASAE